MEEKIKKEIEILCRCETPVGFFGVSISRLENPPIVGNCKVGDPVATVISICDDEVTSEQQERISEKLFELFDDMKDIYT